MLVASHSKAWATIGPMPQYTIEIKVASDEPSTHQQVFADALKQLLIRNTGNPNLITQEPIKLAMANAEKYIQRYTYLKQPGLLLQVRFIPKAVAGLLKAEASTSITIKVTNIAGLEPYNELMTYLKTFTQIIKIDPLNISSSMVELKLDITEHRDSLLEQIGAQGKLIKISDAPNLEYQWLTNN